MNRRRFLSLALLVAVAGCGGSSSSSSEPTPNLHYTADLTSQGTILKQLDGGTKVAGWNRLTGTTTLNGSAAEVEMLGNVAYTNGSGPFFGFLSVTLPDDSTLTMRMDGQATRNAQSGDTAFTCDLEVLGGTGSYLNAKGSGHFTGIRDADLGGLVQIDVHANVR